MAHFSNGVSEANALGLHPNGDSECELSVRPSRKQIPRRPRTVKEEEEEDDIASRPSYVRRTRTVPSENPEEAPPAGRERRSRRNLSRVGMEELGDDALMDSTKRSSRRQLEVPSERKFKSSLSKANGRAATPLDLPFAPTLAKALSAEGDFEEMVDVELGQSKHELRRTRTQIPNTDPSTSREPLYSHPSFELNSEPVKPYTALSSANSTKGGSLMRNTSLPKDSAKDLGYRRPSQRGSALARKDRPIEEVPKDEHTMKIDRPSNKRIPPIETSSKKLVRSSSSRKSELNEKVQVQPLTWFQILLHFLGLIFVQYPFKSHRQWLEKMYKTNRLERPAKDTSLSSRISRPNTAQRSRYEPGASLPSLPEDGSGFTPITARMRRQLHMDGEEDVFGKENEGHHRKRSSRLSGQMFDIDLKPPPGHLPRSTGMNGDRSRGKRSRMSVEFFGEFMHALGINIKASRLKTMNEMEESELTGFQARLYKFIKRHHKGRLALAWEHMIHPLGSMQKKHRRSANKIRLLNAIDKYRAQKFSGSLDTILTSLFLLGQWVFEALSPPKYTKKPMLFTVLFPLILILFFGFMAGEYPFWKEAQNDRVDDYVFGPQELAKWLFRSEDWRTFDDGFLITWGARYLPLVTTESWRWVFSMIIHENFTHLGGNLLLFVLLSWSLESKYGLFRTGLLCWLAGISGNFMSAALEDTCGIVLGASGCVFGLAAFYIVDVIGDFKNVSFPCLRLMGICAFLLAFIIALTSQQAASHFSHIGGFLCGIGLSVVLAPRFIDERIEAMMPWIALFTVLVLLCLFPLFVLVSVIPNLECDP